MGLGASFFMHPAEAGGVADDLLACKLELEWAAGDVFGVVLAAFGDDGSGGEGDRYEGEMPCGECSESAGRWEGAVTGL